VTYIRKIEIPSYIYAKHQYMQESECGSTTVIYIPTEKYKYIVITESDTILQEYYITRKYKSTLYEEIYITKAERCSRLESQSGEELGGRVTAMSKLLLRSDRHGRIRCAL